jgi:hypothetical protein
MKKTYIAPEMFITIVEVSQMLAVSFEVSDETVDGGDALSKHNDWDIWTEN